MPGKRKIIAEMAVSADGFIARPDGSVDWLDRPSPKGGYGMAEFYRSIDTILWGRKTYDVAIEFQKKGVPGSAFDTKMKNYVFTRTLAKSAAPPGVEFVSEPVRDFAARLRATPGKNVWMMGGASITGSFLDEHEIDEFTLTVIPTFIGEGIPLLAPHHRTVPLKLMECKEFSDGVIRLHYLVEKQKTAGDKSQQS
jgi:dihydrofolate reductase